MDNANVNEQKGGVAILILHKVDVKIKGNKRQRRTLYMIKGSIQQEDIILVNIYAPKYIKKILMSMTDTKAELDTNTFIIGDSHPPETPALAIVFPQPTLGSRITASAALDGTV